MDPKPRRTRYFIDTEFAKGPVPFSQDLSSIGIVDQNDREYYAVSSEFNEVAAASDPWLREQVLPQLSKPEDRKTLATIRQDIIEFFQPAREVEIWSRLTENDMFNFSQIFGSHNEMRTSLRTAGVDDVVPRWIEEVMRAAGHPTAYDRPETSNNNHALRDAWLERLKFDRMRNILHREKPKVFDALRLE